MAGLLGGVAAAALAGPVVAAETAANDPAVVEEVVITGSLFKQSVTQSQLVTTVGAEQLRNTGAGNALEALATIGQNQSTITSASGFAGTGFATYANLRALGSERTLVLFDGRRVVNNPFEAKGVDLNTIPLNMIERVESLSDGASSIYGSDAIAGVVNYITKRELNGLSISASLFQPEEDGGRSKQASISGGLGSLSEDGWNIYAGFSWLKKDALHARDRGFSDSFVNLARGFNRVASQPGTHPANYDQAASGLFNINPLNPGCAPPVLLSFGGTACFFDQGQTNDALPEQEDKSVLVHGIAKVAGQTLTVSGLHSTERMAFNFGPLQIFGVLVPTTSPFFPGKGITPGQAGLNPNLPVTITRWRHPDLRPLLNTTKSRTDRVNGQLEGEVLSWDYQLWGLYSESRVNFLLLDGAYDAARMRNGVAGAGGAPFLNPFGAQTAAGAQWIRDSAANGLVRRATSDLTMFGAQVSRNLFDLPAGPVQFALAADYKDESSGFDRDGPTAFAVQQASIPVGYKISRESYSVTSEIKIPILDNFDIDASVRYDHYSDFGGTTNPKVLATWRATDWLTVHGSYNKGFRAPTLYEAGAPTAFGLAPDRRFDPVLCPNGVVNTAAGGVQSRDCAVVPFSIRTGGNANLGPEKSDAYSLGLEVRPPDSLRLGVDYWNYHLKDTIAPLASSVIFGDLTRFGDLIVRCSQVDAATAAANAGSLPNCITPHTGDPIAFVDQTRQNLGDTKTDGLDFHATWRGPDMSWGQVTLEYNGTYVLNYDVQFVPGQPFVSRAGRYADNNFPVIDYSHYAAATWRKDDWTAQLSNRFTNGYTDCNAFCGIAAPFHQKVNSYSLWNLAVTRELGKATITGRVTNIFDKDPPFSNLSVSSGWDPRFTDPIGRAYSLTVRYDF